MHLIYYSKNLKVEVLPGLLLKIEYYLIIDLWYTK